MADVVKIEVDLGGRSYPILIGSGLLGDLGREVRRTGLKSRAAMLVTDANTGPLYYSGAEAALFEAEFENVIEHRIPAGEKGKTWEEYSRCCDALLREFPDTGQVPVVLALGGGVVGDLAGFAASTYRRGVPYVQVPTSLLSAVDSSVGGKTGINHGGVKNIMGAIYQPQLVVTDLAALETLTSREVRSGMAEVIKYGAICSRELFERLERDMERLLALDSVPLREVVAECCRIKAEVVRLDETDTAGVRIVLNFGHTVGHALEMAADGALTHGEAIAIGMVAATRLARSLGRIDENYERRLVELLDRAKLPVTAAGLTENSTRVMNVMRADKKFREGRNRFVLAAAIGEWEAVEDVDDALVREAVESVLA